MALWDKVKKALVGDAPPEEQEESTSKPAPEPQAAAAPSTEGQDVGDYKAVRIEHGKKGWGGPLVVQPTKERPLIYCVTGGGIHPLAQKIADMTGAEAFDGFKSKADFHKIAVAVIDCGGTARVGVYPMKGVLTVDVHSTTPSGPLMKFIKETNFVSGVKEENVSFA